MEFVYAELRKELITTWYGNKLNEDELGMLSKNTAYLFGDNLRVACEQYIRYGIKPNSKYKYGTPPVHPEYGYYNEKLFNPYLLRDDLMAVGFKECRLYGPSGYSRSDITRLVFNALPLRVKYYINSSFVVIAKK